MTRLLSRTSLLSIPRSLFAELSDEVRCAPARFIWICLEARGRSREEFVDLVSRQNILHDEEIAEGFEKGKAAYPATSALGGV